MGVLRRVLGIFSGLARVEVDRALGWCGGGVGLAAVAAVIAIGPGGDGSLLDLFEGDLVASGGGAAVLELRVGVEDLGAAGLAGARAELDANLAVGGGDGGVGAVQAEAAILADAEAEGGCLAQQQLLERGAVGGIAEHGEQGAGTALLH